MPIGAILGGAGLALNLIKGGIDAFSAGSQEKKDKAELEKLTPAFYKVQDEYYQNKNTAAELAQGGFTQDAKDYYGDMAGRGLGTGISGTLQAGGSPNDIARIFDSYNNNIRGMATADSQMQIDNIKYYQQTNKDLAGQKNIQWSVNEYQPYQSKLKELTQRIAADKINKNNAINSVIGGVSSAGTAFSNQDLLNKLFAKGQDMPEDPFSVSNSDSTINRADTTAAEGLNKAPTSNDTATRRPVWSNGEVMNDEQLADIMEMIKQSSRQKE